MKAQNEEAGDAEHVEKIESKRFDEQRLWFIISVFFITSLYLKVGLPFIFSHEKPDIRYFLEIVTDNIFPVFLFLLLPRLFKQIFGGYPIEFIRNIVQDRKTSVASISFQQSESRFEHPTESKNQTHANESLDEKDTISQELFIKQSHEIAEKIYSRAGAYLMLGCSIAFLGLAVFNSNWLSKENYENTNLTAIKNAINVVRFIPPKDSASIQLSKAIKIATIKALSNSDVLIGNEKIMLEQNVLNYLPRFGALFFIEFIAFFFLRQYRIMLEEYRYYESIKRKRQDNFILLNYIESHKENSELVKIISNIYLHADSNRLNKEETTQVLEGHKLSAQELDLFGKLTELVKAIRSK